MEFYLNGEKHFGRTIFVLFDVLEDCGVELTEEDCEKLIDLYVNDEFPQYFYKNNKLDLDKFKSDPECVYDMLN